MNFIPIEFDFHPNEFHTYGMNSASITFIPTAVRSSYHECEKTSVILEHSVEMSAKFLLNSEETLLTFQLNVPVIIRVKVKKCEQTPPFIAEDKLVKGW